MGIGYVNNKAKLIPTIYSSQNLFEQKEIKLSLDNSNNLYSIDYNSNEIEKIKSPLKLFFHYHHQIFLLLKRMKKP